VTQADRAVEEMARAKVAASGLALDVLGEEMGGVIAKSASAFGAGAHDHRSHRRHEEFRVGIQTSAMNHRARRRSARGLRITAGPSLPPERPSASRLAATFARAISSRRDPLRHRRPVALPFNSQFIRAKYRHRNRISLLRNRLEQFTILFPKSHCSPYSSYIIGRHFLIASRESVDMMDRQPDLTLSLCTPSIQSYANVCSRQHRNRSDRILERAAPRSITASASCLKPR